MVYFSINLWFEYSDIPKLVLKSLLIFNTAFLALKFSKVFRENDMKRNTKNGILIFFDIILTNILLRTVLVYL